LKADAEAAMEKLPGLKNSGLRYQFIQRGEGNKL
jgi:hypothetical protein